MEKMTKKRLIRLDASVQREIAKSLGVTDRLVRMALAYDLNSGTAQTIRAYALNHGGELYELVANPYAEVKQL